MKFQWYAIKLSILCIAIFILQTPQITDDFVLVSADVLLRPWILLTSIFLHGSAEHLLSNIFALALFGSILEKIIGGRKFLIIFFLSGIIAGVGAALFYKSVLGASGAIFGVMGCLAAIRPRMVVWVYGAPMPMVVAAGFWAMIDLLGTFSPTDVAHIAHLFGLAFGIVVGLAIRKNFLEQREKKTRISDDEFNSWEKMHMS
ncbi:MAG: rhomboid family intramembrane serine protease [Candidatus Aenigmatarchaeota archaeon]